MTRSTWAATLLALSISLAPAMASAQSSPEAWFAAGKQAFESGDFRRAAECFVHAHEEVPHPAALHNAGVSWQSAGEPARAADAFAEALAMGGLTESQAADARSRLTSLQLTLGRLRIQGPATASVSVAHVEDRTLPASIHLPPGEHLVTVRFAGGEGAERTVVARATDEASITFEQPTQGQLPEPEAPSEGASGLMVAGGIGLGLSAVATGVAIGLGVAALGARDDYIAVNTPEVADDVKDDAEDKAIRLRTGTNIAWVAAGALAATGTALLLAGALDSDEADEDGNTSHDADATLLLTPGGIWLVGEF